MRLASFLEVIRGKLVSQPAISSINRVVFDASKLARGDAFITTDLSTLDQAIKNGAFAVVTDKDFVDKKSEIALIKVDDIDEALIRIFRFFAVEKSPDIYFVNSASIEIANSYIKDSRLVATKDIKTAIIAIQNSVPIPIFLLLNRFVDVAPNSNSLPYKELEIVRAGVFETTLKISNVIFTISLPTLFLSELEIVYALAEKHHLKFQFHSRNPLASRFVASREFFASKVLIFDNTDRHDEAISFVKVVAPWAKIFAPNTTNPIQIATELHKNHFEYAYLNNISKEEIEVALKNLKPKELLFDF